MGEVQSQKWSKHPLEIVRDVFPDVNDEEAECILWERTGWPAFWDGDPETVLRRQLQELKDAPDGRLCDFCNKLAAENDSLCDLHRDDWAEMLRGQQLREVYEQVALARGLLNRRKK